jgi:hypothetical protein
MGRCPHPNEVVVSKFGHHLHWRQSTLIAKSETFAMGKITYKIYSSNRSLNYFMIQNGLCLCGLKWFMSLWFIWNSLYPHNLLGMVYLKSKILFLWWSFSRDISKIMLIKIENIFCKSNSYLMHLKLECNI